MVRPATEVPGVENVDVSQYSSPHSLRNKVARGVWNLVWTLFFRPSPRKAFGWRRLLLRAFGARIEAKAAIYPSCKIWAPWQLEMGEYSCLSHHVDCYNVAPIRLGPHSTVSQYAFLCTAGHDITDPHMRLTTAPITVGEGTWVAAGAFVGPGVQIGDGAVVAARAVVVKEVEAWTVVGGNPARVIGRRKMGRASDEELH